MVGIFGREGADKDLQVNATSKTRSCVMYIHFLPFSTYSDTRAACNSALLRNFLRDPVRLRNSYPPGWVFAVAPPVAIASDGVSQQLVEFGNLGRDAVVDCAVSDLDD